MKTKCSSGKIYQRLPMCSAVVTAGVDCSSTDHVSGLKARNMKARAEGPGISQPIMSRPVRAKQIPAQNRIITSVCALIALLLITHAPAADLTVTNTPRSCCTALDAAKPLSDKSLYQLETTWTNDDAKPVKLESLRGRPQIFAMFFASCHNTCPLLVFQMKKLEASLPAELRGKVGFTLVSFDSQRDTPAALKTYRTDHELSADTWTLLRGDANDVLDLAALLGVKFKQDAQGDFSHSNLITLLNADGEIVYQQVGLNPDDHEFAPRIQKPIAP
jgi:protein SCO1/2